MWWALPVATSLLGMRNANRRREQQEQYNKGQAEVTRYSPWTGVSGKMDTSYTPDALEAGISGGMQGLGMMQAGQAAFGAPAAAATGSGMSGEELFAHSNPNRTPGDDFFQYSNPFMRR